MQTFLPYKSFRRTARCLDRNRLGKQRVEVLQLLRALAGETRGWVNHPAARMWRDYEAALVRYGLAICDEWLARGHRDSCRDRIAAYRKGKDIDPPWLGRRRFHRAHQSNLVRKNPDWYRRFFPRVPDDLPYYWPVSAKRETSKAT